MLIFATKSFRLIAAVASSTFAPMLVALRKNCLDEINSFAERSRLYTSIDFSAKSKDLSLTIFSFLFLIDSYLSFENDAKDNYRQPLFPDPAKDSINIQNLKSIILYPWITRSN
jgi:hypothetical protein